MIGRRGRALGMVEGGATASEPAGNWGDEEGGQGNVFPGRLRGQTHTSPDGLGKRERRRPRVYFNQWKTWAPSWQPSPAHLLCAVLSQ